MDPGVGGGTLGARRGGEWVGGGPAETAFRIPALDLVIFGDAVVNLPGRALELLPDKYCADPARLRAGLRQLVASPFARAVFAHGPALVTEASVRVAALL
jgi:glyoxylase-like metal-dependent hydrolase (beta-lactamase superfamily II)